MIPPSAFGPQGQFSLNPKRYENPPAAGKQVVG